MNRLNYLILSFCMLWTMHSHAIGITQKLTASENLDRLLNLSLEDLLNVQITSAGKTAEKIGEIPASVVVVDRKEIQIYGYDTLGEILEHISGLYMLETYELQGSRNYGVRGFFNTARLIVIWLS